MATQNTMVNQAPPAAVTEGGRRPTGVTATGGERPATSVAEITLPVSVEVVENPQRRRFPRPYKLDILRQVDACASSGEIGALLRRARGERSILRVALDARVSPATLRKIETGRVATPAFPTIAAIADVLGLSLDAVWAEVNQPARAGHDAHEPVAL